MASRRRTFLFVLAFGFSAGALPATVVGSQPARVAQDGTGATFGGQSTVVSTTVAASASTSATSTGDTQTVVETPDPPATRLLTESRKVAAVIAGLVVVALALALLTVRYWRQTKPLPLEDDADVVSDPADEPLFVVPPVEPTPTPAEPVEVAEPTPTPAEPGEVAESTDVEPEPATEVLPASGPDHQGVDADWEPRTGEHPVVRPAAVSSARPTASLRRRALGIPDGS